jgi:Na+-driven multidrug efflux pump
VLRLVGFLVLIPWLGVLGAAISATVSLALATIALNILCRRRTGVDPSILVLLRFPSSKRGAFAVRGADSSD